MARRLTLYILAGLVLGAMLGAVLHHAIADPARLAQVAGWLTIPTDLFLRMIRMIIAPLVLATLVSGIAHMGDSSALGRIGGRTLG